MPKVIAEYKSQARSRIVDAARAVFHKKGFRRATMDDIAREIGVSKGALYRYFRTKTALLTEIQKRSREKVLGSWERLLEAGDLPEGIASSLDAVFSGEVDAAIWHELMGEAASDPEIRAALDEDAREDLRTMRKFLRELEERGRIPRLADRETTAIVILSVLQATVAEISVHGRPNEARRRLIASLRMLLSQSSIVPVRVSGRAR